MGVDGYPFSIVILNSFDPFRHTAQGTAIFHLSGGYVRPFPWAGCPQPPDPLYFAQNNPFLPLLVQTGGTDCARSRPVKTLLLARRGCLCFCLRLRYHFRVLRQRRVERLQLQGQHCPPLRAGHSPGNRTPDGTVVKQIGRASCRERV